MKKILISLFTLMTLTLITANAQAATITVLVDGKSAPWDSSLNPAYSYGYSSENVWNSNLPPTVVNSNSGLSFLAGNTLTIKYLSGLVNAGYGGFNDANGVTSLPINVYPNNTSSYLTSSPVPANLAALMGTFADNSGVIIGTPFIIGNGPFNVIIPTSGSQLFLGVNDGWYNDNQGAFNVQIAEAPVPEPASMLLGLMSLGGVLGLRRKKLS